jgi:hypothetical protein
MKTVDERFWQKVSKRDENSCWEWNAALMNGYGWFLLNKQNGPKFAHRVSAFFAGLIDNINSELHVLHKCDNTKCCNPNHLFIGNNADNVADRVAKGRTKWKIQTGESNGMSKLTDEEVQSIKNLYKTSDFSQSKLAKMFNVRQPHISRIVNETRRSVS